MKKWYLSLGLGLIILGAITAFPYSPWRKQTIANTAFVEGQQSEEFIIGVLSLLHNELEKEPSLWPSYHLNNYPLVLTFDSGNIYAFNLKSDNPAWQQRFFQGREILLSNVDPWGVNLIQFQNDFPIDGVPSFVFHCDFSKGSPIAPVLALLHERFHLHQSRSFINPEVQASGYLDHFNNVNIAWMQVEEMILADYMNAQLDQERSHFHKAAPLADFLAVYKLRQKLIHEASSTWELQQQRFEGVADYVAIKSLERLPGQPFKSIEYLLTMLQASSVNEEILERMTKWRHYAVGASLCYVLDFLEVPDWRSRIEKGLSPVELLSDIIELSDEEAALRIEKIRSRYAFERVLDQVSTAMNAYQEEIADLMDEYTQMEGTEIALFKPHPGQNQSGGGSSLYMYYLADGTTLSLADTSTHRTHDGHWQLSTFGAPMVIKKRDGSLTLKVTEETQVILNGKSYPISAIRAKGKLPFTSLILKGNHCEFHSSESGGLLHFRDGKLTVSYPQ